MIYFPLVYFIIVVAILSSVLVAVSSARTQEKDRVLRKAENAMMAEFGVSREYIQAAISNTEAMLAGRITEQKWLENVQAIAAKYPQYQRDEEPQEVET